VIRKDNAMCECNDTGKLAEAMTRQLYHVNVCSYKYCPSVMIVLLSIFRPTITTKVVSALVIKIMTRSFRSLLVSTRRANAVICWQATTQYSGGFCDCLDTQDIQRWQEYTAMTDQVYGQRQQARKISLDMSGYHQPVSL
jgi:hypothetical protein